MKAERHEPTDAEELLALSCQRPEAAPVFISLVKRAPAALQLVKTNPVLFSLLAFRVSQLDLSENELGDLVRRKKRELVGWLGGIEQEAGVKFIERFEVPGTYGEFERTLRRISDEQLLRESASRPLSEVFQARRYFEAAPELRDVRAFTAELSEATKTIGPPATSRLIAEIRKLGELLGRDISAEMVRCHNGAALDELRQLLIVELYDSAPDKLARLAGYPREFPRAPVAASTTILPVLNEHELHVEGRAMNHCVATQVHEFLEGQAFLFRVLEPQRATLKIKKQGYRLVVEELKLAGNEEPAPATYAAVELWLSGVR